MKDPLKPNDFPASRFATNESHRPTHGNVNLPRRRLCWAWLAVAC
jgi:hypothetical protein